MKTRHGIRGAPLLCAMVVVALHDGRHAVSAQVAQPLNIDADDSVRVAWLHHQGRRVQGRHVVVWYPPDSIAEPQVRSLVTQLDRAMPVLQKAIGGPYPWQELGRARVEYYLGADRFISHARERAVFIPSWRARDGKAPFLHETMHVLLIVRPLSSPLTARDSLEAARMEDSVPDWLAEGLPDALAQTTAAKLSFPEYDVFQSGGPEKVDRTCAARLRGALGDKVLPFIGANGAPPELYTTDRQQVEVVSLRCSRRGWLRPWSACGGIGSPISRTQLLRRAP